MKPHAMWLLTLVTSLSGLVSCAAPGAPATGTLTLNLVGQAPSGTVYRLRHAVITVTGPASRTWNTEDDPDRTSLSDQVPAGDYAASLVPGWNLERIEGTTATPVAAQLISENPALFVVSPEQRTTVPLRFHVDTDVVDMSQGYDLVLTPEESPPQFIVVANANDFDAGSITVYQGNANGDVAPLRTIAGPRTTLSFPGGITVTDDQIIVCDAGIGAIDFFPINARGNVAPTRQIVGFETGLDFCTDVAVFNQEVYVAQLHDLLVFPITANGDAAPTRRIAGLASGDFLAIDEGELYLTDRSTNGGGVLVYALPLTDGAQPTRFLSLPCAAGITAGGGDLFVDDGCSVFGGINLYPQTASGHVTPLRRLSGDDTGMQGPEQIKRVRGELYVADRSESHVFIYRDTASGNTVPHRAIGGPNSGVLRPIGVAVH
jgi:hypothetical protein